MVLLNSTAIITYRKLSDVSIMTRPGQALPEPCQGLNFMIFSPNLHIKEEEQKPFRDNLL